MPSPLHHLSWKILAIGWLVFTTILLVVPGDTLPKTNLVTIPYFDKLVHVGLFAVLSALILKTQMNPRPAGIFAAILLIIAYGTAMEYVQLYVVPNRSFDVMDIIADSFGALIGYLFIRWQEKTG